jgi:hypothetical protein
MEQNQLCAECVANTSGPVQCILRLRRKIGCDEDSVYAGRHVAPFFGAFYLQGAHILLAPKAVGDAFHFLGVRDIRAN